MRSLAAWLLGFLTGLGLALGWSMSYLGRE